MAVGATKDLPFTVTNAGGGMLAGAATTAAPFAIVGAAAYGLAAGQSATITVRFAPTASAPASGAVACSGAGGASVALTGAGAQGPAAPAIATSRPALDFGHVPLSLTPDLTISVTNAGGGTLVGAASTAGPFSIVGPATYSLPAGQSRSIDVRYAPAAVGGSSGALTLTGGAGASVGLSGACDMPVLVKQYTEHVGRITNTPADPIEGIGLKGTDLGVSFALGQDLVFLFGDSWTTDGQNWNDDSVARIAAAPLAPGAVPQLQWFLTPPTPQRSVFRFLTLGVPGVSLGGMEVPIDGLEDGNTTYVFFDTDWDPTQNRHFGSGFALR